ncbi:hypothetical protein [Yinghuangia sp. YIM S10712]|uniref:hypothetical protein n=1 Tax=Yinghuangia sp. YIM S10712 TaxID=3436930 RepID=UPI003F5331A3
MSLLEVACEVVAGAGDLASPWEALCTGDVGQPVKERPQFVVRHRVVTVFLFASVMMLADALSVEGRGAVVAVESVTAGDRPSSCGRDGGTCSGSLTRARHTGLRPPGVRAARPSTESSPGAPTNSGLSARVN